MGTNLEGLWMTNLDEIKTRREKINSTSWKAVEGNSNDIRSSVFAGNDLLATLSPWKRHEYADFIANSPTDIDWLIDAYETAVFELLRQADSVCYMEDGSFKTSAVTHQADILHALEKLGLFEITGFGSYRYVWGNLTPKGEEMMKRAREVQYDF